MSSGSTVVSDCFLLCLLFVFLEKLNIRFVPAEARAGLITAEEKIRLAKLHEENKHFLRIPRRQVEQM